MQSRVIRDRLFREAEGNVAPKVHETGEGTFEVAGRGELQLGVLIESMRREGFEASISRPRVLFKAENGQRLEPIEEVTVDVDDAYTGVVIEKISRSARARCTICVPPAPARPGSCSMRPARGPDRLSRGNFSPTPAAPA